jgi:hypothetical protein
MTCIGGTHLKGTVARDCQPMVFFMNLPHLIHTVKYFRIWFRIHGDFWICICISAVGYSADSNFIYFIFIWIFNFFSILKFEIFFKIIFLSTIHHF